MKLFCKISVAFGVAAGATPALAQRVELTVPEAAEIISHLHSQIPFTKYGHGGLTVVGPIRAVKNGAQTVFCGELEPRFSMYQFSPGTRVPFFGFFKGYPGDAGSRLFLANNPRNAVLVLDACQASGLANGV